MPARPATRLALTLALLATIGLVACSRSTAIPIPTLSTGPVLVPVTIVMTEMMFTPSRFTVPVGSKVVLTLKNVGVVTHDFTIANIDGQQIQQVVAAGQIGTLTFFAPTQPGRWTFFSSQPGQRQAGMVGIMTVR